LNQFFASLGPGMPETFEEFQTLTGLNLFEAQGPLVNNITDALTEALADPSVLPDISGFMTGRAAMLAEFRAVMDSLDIDAFFFPQMWEELGMRVGGSYPATTVSEINLLGTPGVNLPGGYFADGSPFSVQFLGDMWSEGELLAMAYDFEQASMFRIAPTAVPEPSTLAMVALAAAALAVRLRVGAAPSRS
jgi:aspartyl-tRNA(Asn)/glutamyl-tRNA(Gln) amidotransferase subunit A